MDKKTKPIYMLLPRDPPKNERYTQTKMKGMETVSLYTSDAADDIGQV